MPDREYVTEIDEGRREPPELQVMHKPMAENSGGQMPIGRTDEQYAERQQELQRDAAEQRAEQQRDPAGWWERHAQESDLGRDDKELEAEAG